MTTAKTGAAAAHPISRHPILAGITALFGLSNRMASMMSLRPNDEFYVMGRLPSR